jgi:hypothetical protein
MRDGLIEHWRTPQESRAMLRREAREVKEMPKDGMSEVEKVS